MTLQKKTQANKYIKYIYENTGIRFKCKNIKDYIFLKLLYLLLISYSDIDEEFYKPVFNEYGTYNIMKKANYYGYDLHDVINQYLVKYYYSDLSNFAVVWSYYEDLMYDDFEERVTQAYKTLDKKIDKNNEKLNKLLDNITMTGIDYETILDFEHDVKEKKAYIMWHTQRDNVVCEECTERNGKKYYYKYDIPERHPNCRCWLEEVIEE